MFKNLYNGWWIVFACFFLNLFVCGVTFLSFTAFIEPFHDAFGWSYTQISFALSLRGLEMGLFAPLVGILVDRFGSRFLLLWGTIIIGIGLLSLSLVQSLLTFYIAILLISFGAGGCTTVVTITAVASWFKKRTGLALGIALSGVGAGGVIIPLVVYLIDTSGWRLTLVVLGAVMLLFGIPLSLIVKDPPLAQEPDPTGQGVKSTGPACLGTHAGQTGKAFLQILKDRSFLYLATSETVRMIIIAALLNHIMPYLNSVGMSRSLSGTVAAAIPLVSILGRLGFGWCGDRFDKKRVYALIFFIMSVALFAFRHVHSFWALLLFVILFAPAFGGGMVLRGAILQEYFGMAFFGKRLGILFGFASVGGIIGPTLAGWIFDTLGSYDTAWLGLFFLSAMTIVLIMKIQPALSLSPNRTAAKCDE